MLTDEVADTAMGLLLATVRQLPQADAYLRAGKWLTKPFPFTDTLRGKTMGIAGLGRIGMAIARRAEAFGLGLAYHSRSSKPGVPYPYYASLVDMAEAVDILMVITPGGAATKHLINAKVLEALGPKGVLINMSRGSVVDEKALIAALKAGKVGSAGLDVFAHEPNVPKELIDIPHVVLLPHVGSASVHTRNAMGNLVVDNLKHWFAGKGPLTPVSRRPGRSRRRCDGGGWSEPSARAGQPDPTSHQRFAEHLHSWRNKGARGRSSINALTSPPIAPGRLRYFCGIER